LWRLNLRRLKTYGFVILEFFASEKYPESIAQAGAVPKNGFRTNPDVIFRNDRECLPVWLRRSAAL
jgi:hypothetical protein